MKQYKWHIIAGAVVAITAVAYFINKNKGKSKTPSNVKLPANLTASTATDPARKAIYEKILNQTVANYRTSRDYMKAHLSDYYIPKPGETIDPNTGQVTRDNGHTIMVGAGVRILSDLEINSAALKDFECRTQGMDKMSVDELGTLLKWLQTGEKDTFWTDIKNFQNLSILAKKYVVAFEDHPCNFLEKPQDYILK
jgi:hypothetical protein